MRRWSLLPLLLFVTMAAAQTPPVAKKVPTTRTINGDTLYDDYKWIEKKSDPEVIKYLESENAYYNARMKKSEPLVQKINKEIVSRVKETDTDAPVFDNGYWYYSRTVKGQQYPIQCRRKGTLKAKEEVLLDLNALNKGHDYTGIGSTAVSPDNRWLAYSVDHTGFREYMLYVKDLKNPKKKPTKFRTISDVVWAADSRTIFYTIEDKAKRPYRLYRQDIGLDNGSLIYEERDETYWFGVEKTRDDKFILLTSGSKEESEVSYIPADKPLQAPKLIAKRRTEFEYYVDHRDGMFYIRTNQPDAENFRLVTVSDADPREENWKQILAPNDEVMLDGVEVFQNHMVLSERSGGFTRLRVVDFKTFEPKTIPISEAVGTIGLDANPEFKSDAVRYSYESYQNPGAIMSYDVATGKSKVLKQEEVLGGYKASNYVSEIHWAPARDGEKIPITMVRRKTTKVGPNTPMLLYAYGSYGSPTDPYFSNSRVSLLDRGVVFAVAHIRGGGEFGTRWRDEGKMGTKMNTFTDFIDCAEWLVNNDFTSPNKLIAEGASAGGLLTGAVVNMRPDLFLAVHHGVPFVDVINTMLNPDLPLTVGEYFEWGNPNIPEQYQWMKAYSPYDNIHKANYPSMLVTTSLNDSQVMYHEPAKWTAKMRATNPKVDLVLRVEMAGGHGGASGRYDVYRDRAEELAWMLDKWGIAK
jgi:oligopeptidase B